MYQTNHIHDVQFTGAVIVKTLRLLSHELYVPSKVQCRTRTLSPSTALPSSKASRTYFTFYTIVPTLPLSTALQPAQHVTPHHASPHHTLPPQGAQKTVCALLTEPASSIAGAYLDGKGASILSSRPPQGQLQVSRLCPIRRQFQTLYANPTNIVLPVPRPVLSPVHFIPASRPPSFWETCVWIVTCRRGGAEQQGVEAPGAADDPTRGSGGQLHETELGCSPPTLKEPVQPGEQHTPDSPPPLKEPVQQNVKHGSHVPGPTRPGEKVRRDELPK